MAETDKLMNFFLAANWLLIICAALAFASISTIRADGVADFRDEPATKGIYTTARYFPSWPGGANIRVYVHFRPPSTNIPTISPFPSTLDETNEVFVPDTDGKYFLATNSFCGFVELKNESGEQIQLLKPEVNLQEAYPAAYNLKLASKLLEAKVGLGPPLPGCLSGMDPVQCSFHLQKYFNIEKPEDYQLTVWPKIYKRSETNSDLCERIDLPPVTIPIKWTGSSK